MRNANRIGLGAVIAAVAAIAAWALWPRPLAVETAVVARGTYEQTVTEDGHTRVRERHVISAPLGGRIQRIALRAGDAVRAGQVVAQLAPAPPALLDARAERELGERVGAAEAQARRAQAELRRAEAQRAQADADRERTAQLAERGFVAAAAREQAGLAAQVAARGAEAAAFAAHGATHELEQTRAALARYRSGRAGGAAPEALWPVRAPVDGVVLKVVQESEGAVAVGAPLLEIADPRALEVVLDVLTQDAVAIRPGMPATVDPGGGLRPLPAQVRAVEPAAFTKVSALGIEEQRVNVVLDLLVPAEGIAPLGDGFRVDGRIVVLQVPDAVHAPLGALFRDDAGWAVYVVEEGYARKRPVQVLRRNAREAMLGEGVAAGTTVVVYPSDALRDGAAVTARASPGGGR